MAVGGEAATDNRDKVSTSRAGRNMVVTSGQQSNKQKKQQRTLHFLHSLFRRRFQTAAVVGRKCRKQLAFPRALGTKHASTSRGCVFSVEASITAFDPTASRTVIYLPRVLGVTFLGDDVCL